MLKVGDLVVIKDYESIRNAEYQCAGFNQYEMEEFCEKEAQIIDADKNDGGHAYYKLSVDQNNRNNYIGGYTWQDNWLTEVIEAPYCIDGRRMNVNYSSNMRLKTVKEMKSEGIYNFVEFKDYIFYNGFMPKKFYEEIKNKRFRTKGYNCHSSAFIEIKIGKEIFTIPSAMVTKGEKIMEEEKEYSEEEKKLMAEMIKKIDVKRFKKLLASSFQIPSTKLFGIEKILQKWAENKLELYKLLGNNISISREIEYNADERTWKENVENLIKMFPRNRLYA